MRRENPPAKLPTTMPQRFFQLERHRTTVGREMQAGLTTFAAMAYIPGGQPTDIPAHTGMDKGALVTVTAVTAALATTDHGAADQLPDRARAGRMGINAFFTFTICLGKGVRVDRGAGHGVCQRQTSSSSRSPSTGVREKIIGAIPVPLKIAVTCGIGMFIAFIGLKNGGVIVANPATFVAPGDFSSGPAALCLAGIILMAILVARRVPAAIVISIALVTLAGLFVPDGHGGTVTAHPAAIFSKPASPAPVFLKLTFHFLTNSTAFFAALPLILTLLLVDMFDNIGTLIGVTKRAGLLDAEGRLPNAGRALLADSTATILSALLRHLHRGELH